MFKKILLVLMVHLSLSGLTRAADPMPIYGLDCDETSQSKEGTETVSLRKILATRHLSDQECKDRAFSEEVCNFPFAELKLDWHGYKIEASVFGSPGLTITLPGGTRVFTGQVTAAAQLGFFFPDEPNKYLHMMSCMVSRVKTE